MCAARWSVIGYYYSQIYKSVCDFGKDKEKDGVQVFWVPVWFRSQRCRLELGWDFGFRAPDLLTLSVLSCSYETSILL